MGDKGDSIQLFEDQKIRTAWDEEQEEWYFSVVDVVAVLTEQKSSRSASNYWAKLKQRLKAEGASQLLTNCQQLKMTASDGKKRLTDVASTEQLLRIIQSIPSPKAEPSGFSENRQVAQTGGTIAGNTRREIEKATGKPVISSQNAIQLNRIVTDMIEGSAEILPDDPPEV